MIYGDLWGVKSEIIIGHVLSKSGIRNQFYFRCACWAVGCGEHSANVCYCSAFFDFLNGLNNLIFCACSLFHNLVLS
jgi:hypothetical protein